MSGRWNVNPDCARLFELARAIRWHDQGKAGAPELGLEDAAVFEGLATDHALLEEALEAATDYHAACLVLGPIRIESLEARRKREKMNSTLGKLNRWYERRRLEWGVRDPNSD